MLIRTEQPGKDFTYPCSKSQIKRIFGEDLLNLAYFGEAYRFEPKGKYPTMSGIVIANASSDPKFGFRLSVFQTEKGFYCPGQRDAFLQLLETDVRPWIEARKLRSMKEFLCREQLLVEFVGGGFKLHPMVFTNEWL